MAQGVQALVAGWSTSEHGMMWGSLKGTRNSSNMLWTCISNVERNGFNRAFNKLRIPGFEMQFTVSSAEAHLSRAH